MGVPAVFAISPGRVPAPVEPPAPVVAVVPPLPPAEPPEPLVPAPPVAPPATLLPPRPDCPPADAPPVPVAPPEPVRPPEAVAPPMALLPPNPVRPPEALVAPPVPLVPPEPLLPPEPTWPPELLPPPVPVWPPELVTPPEPVTPPEMVTPPEPFAPPLPDWAVEFDDEQPNSPIAPPSIAQRRANRRSGLECCTCFFFLCLDWGVLLENHASHSGSRCVVAPAAADSPIWGGLQLQYCLGEAIVVTKSASTGATRSAAGQISGSRISACCAAAPGSTAQVEIGMLARGDKRTSNGNVTSTLSPAFRTRLTSRFMPGAVWRSCPCETALRIASLGSVHPGKQVGIRSSWRRFLRLQPQGTNSARSCSASQGADSGQGGSDSNFAFGSPLVAIAQPASRTHRFHLSGGP
jgi:hypothetical protein